MSVKRFGSRSGPTFCPNCLRKIKSLKMTKVAASKERVNKRIFHLKQFMMMLATGPNIDEL